MTASSLSAIPAAADLFLIRLIRPGEACQDGMPHRSISELEGLGPGPYGSIPVL